MTRSQRFITDRLIHDSGSRYTAALKAASDDNLADAVARLTNWPGKANRLRSVKAEVARRAKA